MDWHGLDMKDRTGRERWCEVWWVPCQILCPRVLSDGFLPFLGVDPCRESAQSSRRKHLVSNRSAWWKLWLYHITVKAQTKAKFRLSFLLFYFEMSGGGPNVRRWNIAVICLESAKRTSLNHLIWCTSLSCWLSLQLRHSGKTSRPIFHTWMGIVLKQTLNAMPEQISNKTSLGIFL